MRTERALEQAILDRFFEQLAAREDFPPSVVARLAQLRKGGTLQAVDEIIRALKEGTTQND